MADRGTQSSSLLSDARLSTIGAVGGTLLSGVASILIARGLGVADRGRWAAISSVAVLVATIAATGLPTAAAYAGSRLVGVERERLVRAALTGAGGLAAIAVGGYLVVVAVIHPPAPTTAVIVGCTIPAAMVCYAVSHQLTLAASSMTWFALAQLISAVVTLAVVAGLYVTGALTIMSVVVISALGASVGALVSLIGLRISVGGGGRRSLLSLSAAVRILRPYLSYALTTFATLSLTQIVQRVDVLLVSGFKGPHAAGLYAVAGQVTDLLLVVPGALGVVMFRRSAGSIADHYLNALLVLRWTGVFAVAAALCALAIAGWIMPIVFGASYQGSVEPLRLMLPGTVAFSLQSVLSNYLAGRGRPRILLIAWLTGAVSGVGADIFVIPAYGITGAAIVSSLSYVLITALHFQALARIRPVA